MIRTLLLAAALLSASACLPLSARPIAGGGLVAVDVVDRDSGQALPEYPHRGDTWIPGEPGHRYSVRLHNRSGERVLVVLSVDGVNAVSGETASPSQAGYVLDPWETTEIAGWRKSLQDVAQFYFTDLPDSYAARTGRPDNVGVIGAAVFREKRARRIRPMLPRPTQPSPVEDERAAAAAPAASAKAEGMRADRTRQQLGTGHGEREWDPVDTTQFVRASVAPAQVLQLRYDAPERLYALGIAPRRWPYADRDAAPQAFPGRFVADPP